jgi:hypothetical protein
MDAISDFFRSCDEAASALDERTWNDLLMDRIVGDGVLERASADGCELFVFRRS